ncbi:MAG: porphobilinogen synthase [Nitrospiraceae bacterium]|nr:porphobilinogen synthase [Nitrospiraceae bacterium]
MSHPVERPRRLRNSPAIRNLVREVDLSPDHLILPLFVTWGSGRKEPISSMPGVFRYSLDRLPEILGEAWETGIRSLLLFGIPQTKDETGSEALNPDGPVPMAIGKIRSLFPDYVIMTDICIDEYTTHGHCGLVCGERIENDPTLDILSKMALLHAQAGADIVAPSDMMDGRVMAIRTLLDRNAFTDTLILSYAVKYASGFYGPFREAMMSGPQFGDRSSYQMDYRGIRDALREARLDAEEGADILMVKPALSYLDIITRVSQTSDLPVAAYQVSGEYSMICAAGQNGWIDQDRVMIETLTAIRRAGAQMIVTYFAVAAARLLGR